MAFKVDVRERDPPLVWETAGRGVRATPDPDYAPALYVGARGDRAHYLDWLADELAADPKVRALARERWYRSLRADERSPVLRVELERLADVERAAREIRRREHDAHAPGVLRLYDVDLDPQFRYCLDTGRDPVPDRDLRSLDLAAPYHALERGEFAGLTLDGEPAGSSDVAAALAERDPDVLVLSSGELVPLLAGAGVDLGRRPGYRTLAGESTYESYGRVGHSPARYDVPGRVLVDRSNSFLLGHAGMAGLEYFVAEAGKPLQELARDSIGGVLTAVEVRAARERDVLAPWQKRQTEAWKPLDTLRAADRGGHSFQPEVGVHEGVHELDFASLYPNVIREYGVSPETVNCGCCSNERVPELGYTVCEKRDGFLGAVLGPLLDDRARWKRRLRAGDDRGESPNGRAGSDVTREQGDDGVESLNDGAPLDAETAAALEAKADAVKWVLVSCFGYQGYRHAKFGRIETHEAINAHARDVLHTAKEHAEEAGWRVVHGIVDSLWLAPDPGRAQAPVEAVAAAVSEDVDIALEHEAAFEWIAFCPRTRASGGAIMRYFGKRADGSFKLRGIEARQRTTCAFVADAQRDLLETFDRERTPEAVVARLPRHLAALRRGDVSTERLAITQRVTRRREEYRGATRGRAVLERLHRLGRERHPGQSVSYVVADDDRDGPARVRLAFEDDDAVDCDFYAERLVSACASVVSPLGWDAARVRRALREDRDATLAAFGE